MAGLTSSQAELKANEFIELAVSSLTKLRVFNKEKKWEESASMYEKAADHFKIARQYMEAGDAFNKAGEMMEQSPRPEEATDYFMQAAKAYKTGGSMKDAASMYEKVVVRYQARNQFAAAAKLYKELAELEEKEQRPKEAIDAYQKAADCYKAEDIASHANECLMRIAEISASEAMYPQAQHLFEKVAADCVKNPLIRFNSNEYYLKAAVCCLPECMERNDDGQLLARKLDQYKSTSEFGRSREYNFINKVLEAFELRNVDEFTDAVYLYDKNSRVEGWVARVLLMAKNFIKDPSTLRDFDDKDLQ